jgi:acylphosphatase
MVSGRVQGVGFRWFVRGEAEELGLDGTVANLPDGTVEIHAAGPDAALDELELRVHRGPPGARVDDLRSERLDALADRGRFDIVH